MTDSPVDDQYDQRLDEVRKAMLGIQTPTREKMGVVNEGVMYPLSNCDEITPEIFIGDGIMAYSREKLKRLGFTHVVNASQGDDRNFHVTTSQEFYVGFDIKYFGIEKMMDNPRAPISQFFEPVSDFIEDCVSNKGRVYVHCYCGVSRSSTLVIAYLMMKQGLSLDAAITKVRKAREVRPNDGFLKQLIQLEDSLTSK